MLTPLNSAPNLITPEDYEQLTSSTPDRFDQNPPILRFHDEQVEVSMAPVDGFEGWNGKVAGKIWVTEAAVSFLPASGVVGWTLPYPSLTLHALTPSSGDAPAHVYCQVDESGNPAMQTSDQINGDADGEENEHEGGGDDEFTAMREVRIYLPEAKLQPLFAALSQCSALHDSLLPNGEPSSFFGFGGDDESDDEGWEDADEHGDEGVDGGRAAAMLAKFHIDAGGKEEVEGDEDPIERFLNLVEWGDQQKPYGWDGVPENFEDAEEEK